MEPGNQGIKEPGNQGTMPGEDCEGSGVLGKRGGEALPSETNAGTEQLGLAVIKEK